MMRVIISENLDDCTTYSLPKYGADGEFGSETEKALKAFQRKIGIKQDGLYGSETHQALMDAVADDDEGKVDNEPETETTDEVKPPRQAGPHRVRQRLRQHS